MKALELGNFPHDLVENQRPVKKMIVSLLRLGTQDGHNYVKRLVYNR